MLIYGESEVRFLEGLPADVRRQALAQSFATAVPCVLITGGLEAPPDLIAEAERAGVPLLTTQVGTATAIGKLTALLEERLAVREVIHGVLRGHPRARRADRGGERHRQERVRARSGRPRPSTRRRRHRRGPPPRRLDHRRQLPRADAASHGSARARADQPARSLRRGVDADVEAGRARRAARALGSAARIRSSRHRRRRISSCSACACRSSACRSRPGATSRSWSRSRRGTSCCAGAASTPRASWWPGSMRGSCDVQPADDIGRRSGSRRIAVSKRRGDRKRRTQAARKSAAKRSGARELPGRDRHVGRRQVARDSRARGPRLLLRGQSADAADSGARRSVAPRARRQAEGGGRRRRARGRLHPRVSADLAAPAGHAGSRPGAGVPRSERRRAVPPIQRNAPAASAGARSAGQRSDRAGAAHAREDPRAWRT